MKLGELNGKRAVQEQSEASSRVRYQAKAEFSLALHGQTSYTIFQALTYIKIENFRTKKFRKIASDKKFSDSFSEISDRKLSGKHHKISMIPKCMFKIVRGSIHKFRGSTHDFESSVTQKILFSQNF